MPYPGSTKERLHGRLIQLADLYLYIPENRNGSRNIFLLMGGENGLTLTIFQTLFPTVAPQSQFASSQFPICHEIYLLMNCMILIFRYSFLHSLIV